MKTPTARYRNDVHYRHLVDRLEAMIEEAQFTPSEIREAAILACTNYEMRRGHLRGGAFEIDANGRIRGPIQTGSLPEFVAEHQCEPWRSPRHAADFQGPYYPRRSTASESHRDEAGPGPYVFTDPDYQRQDGSHETAPDCRVQGGSGGGC